MEKLIGDAIRALRRRKGMTLESLAREAGLSKGYLSKLERGLKLPPISTLSNIAGALGAEIAEFFQTERPQPKISHVRARERTRVSRAGSSFGYYYESLAERFRDKAAEPFIIILTPDTKEHPLFSHEGQEMIFVLEGRMLFSFGGEHYVCEPGDCLYFDARVEHRGECLGPEEARALVVIVPGPVSQQGMTPSEANTRMVSRGKKGEKPP